MTTRIGELAEPETPAGPAGDGDRAGLLKEAQPPVGSRRAATRAAQHLHFAKKMNDDFGFVPSTRADDGDPLDVLVLMDAPVFPGCVVLSRVIGGDRS